MLSGRTETIMRYEEFTRLAHNITKDRKCPKCLKILEPKNSVRVIRTNGRVRVYHAGCYKEY